jgi:class 3 adenylate cyclase
VARLLADQGFPSVSVLRGGLEAWRKAGLPIETLLEEAPLPAFSEGAAPSFSRASASLLPSLADRYLREGALPARRRLTTLFVDIAGSTLLLAQKPPEEVLAVVQRFMRTVTEVALAYCGDVKDFEGDGALLYFESTAEAAQAALAIRAALKRGGEATAHPIAARMSLTVGDVVLGLVGTALRQAVELVGPSLSVAARLLKQVPPGGIIATGEVVEGLRTEAPALAGEFLLRDRAFVVPDAGGITVATYVSA